MQSISPKRQIRVQMNNNESIDKTFKEYAKTISQSIQKLNSFTNNLQDKVNILLKAQQTQFVTSYKNHMAKIKQELNQMDKKIIQYQQKIQFYQSQGRLSLYIKKVNFMEYEQVKLFDQITQKDKKIKDLTFQIEMLKKLQKESDDKIKIMYRKRIEDEQKKQVQTQKQSILKKQQSQANLDYSIANKHMTSIQTFTTQIPSYHYSRRGKLIHQFKQRPMTKLITQDQQKSILYKSQQQINLQDQFSRVKQNDLNMKNYKITTLEKQNHHLKVQNKKLLLFNSKYANNLSQLGEFFLKTVQELKKSVIIKRKIKNQISFEDFCKEDKLVLIATLLSNEAAVAILYDRIFKPHPKKNRAQSVLQKSYGNIPNQALKSQRTIEQVMQNPQGSQQLVNKHIFPSIKSKRLVY